MEHLAKSGSDTRGSWMEWLCVGTGIVLAAAGLELFLKPNRLVAGGVQGLSILLSHATEKQLAFYLFTMNLPFFWLRRSHLAPRPVVVPIVVLSLLTLLTFLLDPVPPLTEDPLLASVMGGLTLGYGVGLILRRSAYMDGIHEAASWLRGRLPLSVAELVMLANLALLTVAAFSFGPERALYSGISCALAYPALKAAMKGSHSRLLIRIRCKRPEPLRAAVLERFGDKLLVLHAVFEPPDSDRGELHIVAERAQHVRLLRWLKEVDPQAEVISTPFESPADSAYSFYG